MNPKLSIAQFFRYGACYEDEEHPYPRSLTHFYNPQSGGDGVPLPLSTPNSLRWMLQPEVGNDCTGVNHYNYKDARDYFYLAMTSSGGYGASVEAADAYRGMNWGLTFQALGHVIHHLQGMGSPQHVRSDYHCNSVSECKDTWKNILGNLYRPSGYETYFDERFDVVKALAQSASGSKMLGLPREFWSTSTRNDLTTVSVSGHLSPNDGLAAYTSTNFASEGQNFQVYGYTTGSPKYGPAPDNAIPVPRVHSMMPMSTSYSTRSIYLRSAMCKQFVHTMNFPRMDEGSWNLASM